MIGFGGTGTVAIAGWTGTVATDVVVYTGLGGWTGTVVIEAVEYNGFGGTTTAGTEEVA